MHENNHQHNRYGDNKDIAKKKSHRRNPHKDFGDGYIPDIPPLKPLNDAQRPHEPYSSNNDQTNQGKYYSDRRNQNDDRGAPPQQRPRIERGPRQQGIVKFFNSERGFGFIMPESGGHDIFVHISAVERADIPPLQDGQHLSFETEPDRKGKGLKAVFLRMIDIDHNTAMPRS